MINIWINNKSLEIDLNLNLLQLLAQINSPTHGIAISINNEICSQNNWETTFLQNQDKILIIQATQGG